MRAQVVVILLALYCSLVAEVCAADHRNAQVAKLQSTYADTNCFYFTLVGVNEADGVTPANSWFAISRSQLGASDAYATLLGAKLSGAPVWVTTSGEVVCGGYAGVEYLLLE